VEWQTDSDESELGTALSVGQNWQLNYPQFGADGVVICMKVNPTLILNVFNKFLSYEVFGRFIAKIGYLRTANPLKWLHR